MSRKAMITHMSFTRKLDNLMKEHNINKAELARASGIPYTTIDGFYKRGTNNTKLSTLKKLCAYFNCSLDYLINDDIDKEYIAIEEMLVTDVFTKEEMNAIYDFALFIKSKRVK